MFYNSGTSFFPLKMCVIGLKEEDMIPLLNSTQLVQLKIQPKSPKYHFIILENIKQDDKMEISESSNYVDFIWCLLRTKWLYEMKIKVCVYVCVGVRVPVYVLMHSRPDYFLTFISLQISWIEIYFWFQMFFLSLPALVNSKRSYFP